MIKPGGPVVHLVRFDQPVDHVQARFGGVLNTEVQAGGQVVAGNDASDALPDVEISRDH